MNQNLESLRDELEHALGGLDERQTQLRPAENTSKWSIQQIVGHLRLTYAATVDAMDARIAKGAATKAKPSLVQYIGQYTLIRIGYFPRGRVAPHRVVASLQEQAVPSGLLISQVTEALAGMDLRVAAAEKLFGANRRVISHMVLGPLSIEQWRRFHLIHGRHHIKQIKAIRKEHGV